MVNIESGMENETKSSVKDENYEISYSNEEHEQKSWSNQDKLIGENYKEKIMSLLNKEFVQVGLQHYLFYVINNHDELY